MLELVLTVLLLGWASYRITRFFVEDTLLGMGSHSQVENGSLVEVPNSPLGEAVFRFAYNGEDGSNKGFIRGRIGDLLGCTFCLGAWVSFSAWALWTWTLPWQVGVQFQQWWVCAFAVAGVQAYLNSRPDA